MLVADNKTAGLFTTPYVTTTIETIKVGNLYIAPTDFVRIVNYLKPFITQAEKAGVVGAPSTFELLFGIALIYFKEQKCQWAVLEVGLGGRYDMTNIIKKPVITAITNIDYDHTEILGETLREIAHDKAGIIKPKSLFYTAEQRPAQIKQFKTICTEVGAVFHQIPKQKDYCEYNKILATQIAQAIKLTTEAIEQGIKNSKLPCRFEMIATNPITILDGAHNRSKILSTVISLKGVSYKKLFLILAVSNLNKDWETFFEPIVSIAHTIILTSGQSMDRKLVDPRLLAQQLKKYTRKINIIADPKQALTYTQKQAKKDDCILVTGSFFLAGELRKEWYSEQWVLKNRKSFK